MNGLPVHVFHGQCINPTLHLSCRNVSSIVKIFIQSIMCTEPHEVSLLSLLWYVHSGGGVEVMSEVRRGAQVRKIFVLCKGDKSHSFLDNLSLSLSRTIPSLFSLSLSADKNGFTQFSCLCFRNKNLLVAPSRCVLKWLLVSGTKFI